MLMLRRDDAPSLQVAALFHAFERSAYDPKLGATWLSEEHTQGPDAASFVPIVRDTLAADRAQVCLYESRYLEVKARQLI